MPQLDSPSSRIPPLPSGYQLDSDGAIPPLPQGYTLDSTANAPLSGAGGSWEPKTPALSLPAHGAGSLGPGQPEATPGMGLAGAAGLGLGIAGPPLAARAAPYVAPAVASYAISKARELPVVGPVISKIPFAEALPWLWSGKGKGAAGRATAEVETGAAAGTESAAPRLIDQMGGKPVETITEKPIDEAYYLGPRPSIQRGPFPGSREDILESKSLQEQVRNAAEGEQRTMASQEKRDWFARNQPGSSKGELTGTPDKPVKFTKTPGVKLKDQIKAGTTVPGPSEDLTLLLKKSLKQAVQERGQ